MTRRQKNFRSGRYRYSGPARKTSHRPPGPENHAGLLRTTRIEQEVLAYLFQKKEPQTLADILAALSLDRAERKIMAGLLADMCRQNLIACTGQRKGGKLYSFAREAALVEGVVEVHPRGYGFAIISDRPGISAPKTDKSKRQDPFIAPDNLGSAHQGDRALFRLIPRTRGRTEAVVVKVVKRAATSLVGTFEAGRETSLVIPEDERLLFNVLVHRKDSCGARNGDAVVVAITDFKGGKRNPAGRITEVLGDPDDLDVQAEIVIRKYRLHHRFSEEALQETENCPDTLPEDDHRLDLRGIPHVTIDGETARDFDDAVAVEKTAKGWRLYVSIADVSYYVKPGSALDREAFARGTSVYFPNRVVPMLPERLSNNLCSLVPDKPRPTFTTVMEFDRKGKRLAQQFSKSIIVSRHRLTYTIVKRILADRDNGLIKQYSAIVPQLQDMAQLAGVLEQKRIERGSIGFSIPEAEVLIDADKQVADVVRAERNMAHKLIEEFMLAANEAVAARLAANDFPTLYRIHEPPENLKVREFTAFARTLGLRLAPDGGSPKWFGKVLTLVAGTPKEYIVNNLLLRTMQRARYSPENLGHFGLAAEYYTHFTSPIRRYPDLVVHRTLSALLARKKRSGSVAPAPDLQQAGDFLSGRERVAVDAEREMTERLQIRFMRGRIGETFEGIVSGVTGFGLFIELLDHFVSGAIEIAGLKDDYYQFDEKQYRLVGSHTGRTFQIGDLVSIRVAAVDTRQRRINFVLA